VKRVMGTGQDSPQLHRASSVEEVELSGTPPPGLAPGKPDRWEGYGVSTLEGTWHLSPTSRGWLGAVPRTGIDVPSRMADTNYWDFLR
jgi:hypothetical protein